uniref:Replication-associated protein n=1 Tax=Potato leafroll virus TaxID=12045 RepID=A0A223PQF9_PLRV|nr:replication-associated protein [Potato leafroll virus]
MTPTRITVWRERLQLMRLQRKLLKQTQQRRLLHQLQQRKLLQQTSL